MHYEVTTDNSAGTTVLRELIAMCYSFANITCGLTLSFAPLPG
jgi:hypothetical protein